MYDRRTMKYKKKKRKKQVHSELILVEKKKTSYIHIIYLERIKRNFDKISKVFVRKIARSEWLLLMIKSDPARIQDLNLWAGGGEEIV